MLPGARRSRRDARPAAVRWIERQWLVPASPQALALLRGLAGAYMLGHLGRRRRMLRRVAASDRALFSPVGTTRALSQPLSPRAFRGLLEATQVLNVAFTLGVRHRVTGPLYGVSLLSLLSYRNSWSMIYHTDPIPVLHALVLGAAPAADALSVDAVLRRRRRRRAHWRYGAPIRVMNTLTVATYVLAGIAKVKGPLGWRWSGGGALRSQIAADGLRKELMGEGASPLTFRLYTDRRALLALRALAAGSLVVELGAPVALVDRRLARLWSLGAFGMHWGIFGVMRIKFRYQMSGLAFASLVAGGTALRTAPTPARDRRELAIGGSVAMLAAVAWPVRENWRAAPRDGFPLSYYPMFTARRRPEVRETYLIGRTAGGERRALHYRLAGAGGLNLVRRQLRRMARAGRGEEVCLRVAARLVARGDDDDRDIVRVELVSGRFRLERYFAGEHQPVTERVRAGCDVPWPHATGTATVAPLADRGDRGRCASTVGLRPPSPSA